MFIIEDLYKLRREWSVSWMILTVIAPFYVSYVTVGSIFMQRIRIYYNNNYNSNKMTSKTFRFIMYTCPITVFMTPIALIYFVFIDGCITTYVILTRLVYFLSFLKVKPNDKILEKSLGLNAMQTVGYRRMRTLSKLLFNVIFCYLNDIVTMIQQ